MLSGILHHLTADWKVTDLLINMEQNQHRDLKKNTSGDKSSRLSNQPQETNEDLPF